MNPEKVLAPAVVVLAVAGAFLGWRWPGWWERPLARLARRRRLAILTAAAVPLILRLFLLPLYPPPEPRVQDEFSFLLGADTLAHLRLANTPHPMWEHFETMHVLMRPTYASAFPPGPAAAMALGKVLLGSFWSGMWLSAGVMCGAICWMLMAWLPPRWALLGALLLALRIGVSSYWMNSYWGGCVAAIGGALALGSLPRLRREPGWRYAAVMMTGMALLANSRSFEGLIFGLAIGAALLCWMISKQSVTGTAGRILVPLGVFLALLAAGMMHYFAHVTGDPLLPPYVLYRNTTTVVPHFLWQKPGPAPAYRNPQMRDFYTGWEMSEYTAAKQSFAADLFRKAGAYWRFYIGILLTIPLLALPWLWSDKRARELLWIGAAFSLALWGQVWHNLHYAAPATGLVFLILILGMRRLRLWRWRGRAIGLHFSRWVPIACAAMLAAQIAAGRASDERTQQAGWRWPPQVGMRRAGVLHELESLGGQHLVIVRYSATHDPGDEWVYNAADIDRAPVVWARELDDPAKNAQLLEYFRGRKVWLVQPDQEAPHPEPYRQ